MRSRYLFVPIPRSTSAIILLLVTTAGVIDWGSETPLWGAFEFFRAPIQTPSFAHPEALASTQWLEQHLRDPDLRIVDARYPQSDAAFQAGHVPGAVKVDPLVDLADPTQRPLYLVPTTMQFEALMSRLGIGNSTTVVAANHHKGITSDMSSLPARPYPLGKKHARNREPKPGQ
jgi:hypothetical protein